MTTRVAMEFDGRLRCEIRYHPGKANVVADALSKRNESNHMIKRNVRSHRLLVNGDSYVAVGENHNGFHLQKLPKTQAARDRQRSYANLRRKPLEFQVGDRVMLKVSPRKGVI
ncbi:hypothetical protein Tco_1016563 [Tanacetum coccineum]|uniref:Reverse transcriptase domain-containing protein n=1 Tax=Tanacetum coccineum TaxID=301880 RepID=A0ABQ5FP07_9ASTR